MVHDCTIPQTAQTGGATFTAMLHSSMSSYVFIRTMLPVGENSILLLELIELFHGHGSANSDLQFERVEISRQRSCVVTWEYELLC